MFPPPNINNPFDYSFKKPSLLSDQNPSSTLLQDQDSPFLFTNFPSPFFDEHESPLNQILLQNQAHQTTYLNKTEDPTKSNSKKFNLEPSSKLDAKETRQLMSSAPLRRRNQLGVVPRRRTGKKDRHSKICTAQGIRDRRMRLSLQVARKFFDLQDILGYDKASKTIEWLFTQSKKAINELKHSNISNTSDAKSESFVSECEVVSGNDEMSTLIASAEDEKTILPFCSGENHRERFKSNREAARDKARARARCRTREKVMMKALQSSGQWCKSNPSADDDLDRKLGFSNSPFGDNADNQEFRVSPTRGDVYEPQQADVGTIEKLLGDSICPTTTSSAAAVTGLNLDPNSNFMGFIGNWESLLAGNHNYTIYPTIPKFQGFHQ